MSENKNVYTFWKLIRENRIIIPNLQRDYAQGREHDETVKQIRTSLIEEIYRAVTENNNPLVLNFIFGTKKDDIFIPIDGQQRLTTLFLFHWYVFVKTGYISGLERLTNFSYETRDTSERFCKNICKINILDFSENKKISEQIEDFSWFTGNFKIDPTIKSMLVVMDEFHNKFKYLSDSDFESIKSKLLEDDCPVSFLGLPISDSLQTSDLYIKMNARGKLLSDFEIFKAKLQNSVILTRLLEQTKSGTTEQDKVKFISKYNNEYAELFYKLFNKDYDNAMMSFIKEMLRNSYLREVSRSKVGQKAYRNEYPEISKMTGSVFFRYIDNGGGVRSFEEPEQAFIDGLKRADDLLHKLHDKFLNMENPLIFENTLQREGFSELEKNLFITNHTKPILSDEIERYSLYSFLYKFRIATTDMERVAYDMWKRMIYNITKNSTIDKSEQACETFVIIEEIIDAIKAYDENNVLSAISNTNSISSIKPTSAIYNQMQEEIIKAKLIIENYSWKDKILDAENYFIDGEIGFILDCSRDGDTYNIGAFQKYCEFLMKIFDRNKKLRPEISKQSLEQALLCMSDNTETGTGHLLKQTYSSTCWKFPYGEYKDFLGNETEESKKMMLKELIDKLISTNAQDADSINAKLTEIVKNVNESQFNKAKWKLAFIKNNLFDSEFKEKLKVNRFNNCIHIGDKREILMLTRGTTRSWSMELYTFLLYKKLDKLYPQKAILCLDTTSELEKDDFPRRYIEMDNGHTKIGYDYNDNSETPYLFNKAGKTSHLSEEGVIQKLQKDNANS